MKSNASEAVTVRALSGAEMDGLVGAVGTMLMREGYSPEVHTRKLLTYKMEVEKKRGIYVGLFAPLKWIAPGVGLPLRRESSKFSKILVQFTDLPIGFSVEEGSGVEITVAHAVGVSAPKPILREIKKILAPFVTDIEKVKSNAGRFLTGKKFDKKVPGVACDHCGLEQEVTIPVEIARVEGGKGYGPGGSATVLCSNPDCEKTFDVTWDGIIVEVEYR